MCATPDCPPRLDAVLHDPPRRQPGTVERPRLKDVATLWEPLSVLWHNGSVQEMQMHSGAALRHLALPCFRGPLIV